MQGRFFVARYHLTCSNNILDIVFRASQPYSNIFIRGFSEPPGGFYLVRRSFSEGDLGPLSKPQQLFFPRLSRVSDFVVLDITIQPIYLFANIVLLCVYNRLPD